MSERGEQAISYRRNVAVVVVDELGRLLACHRVDMAGVWQIPQGGIDENESDEQAMMRELKEEIGTNEVEVLGKLPNKIRYDWPEQLFSRGYCGQEQTYFLVKLKKGAAIDLSADAHREFDKYEWVGADEFLKRLSGFKKKAYTEAIEMLLELCPNNISR